MKDYNKKSQSVIFGLLFYIITGLLIFYFRGESWQLYVYVIGIPVVFGSLFFMK